MTLTTLFPSAFPALALAHFLALLSPGQDFFLIVSHAIRHRLKGSRHICTGIALGNAVYIGVAILGWSGIRDNPVIFSAVEALGAGYLLWVGCLLLRSKKNNQIPEEETGEMSSIPKQLLLGINSALLNPKNALFYMSLMTVILGNKTSLLQQVVCGVWMVCVVLVWDLWLAAMIGHPRVQCGLKQSIHLIERGAGVVLIGIGMGIFLL
ncbi:threonine transporter RhtB [Vibrio sp. HA2012]|uniref:LysE family translocator n=1 Tax=Vibrio sp. HA2012 TaxID=1971595 RepID=UPI000C2B888A|nr:LysE family transporter [Vibrio sp. HA2012]PJC87588.1 threonine transporter RhtB [Vibrio sp. HA2012]